MMDFADVVTTEASLRETMGGPMPRAVRKEIALLDAHCRALIAASPFVLVGSGDDEGNLDVSPKGDRPGFVQVLDEHTLAIPDRPGNRRADTFTNVVRNAGVGLLFLIPGKLETLRVNGRARIVRDASLLASMTVAGKTPALALVVTVEQAFIHCGKCMLRSGIWDASSWPDVSRLPSQAQCLVDHASLTESLEEVQASIEESRRTRLY
jgi:uncharacterized protein